LRDAIFWERIIDIAREEKGEETHIFEGGREGLESFSLCGLVVAHAIAVLLETIVLVLEHVDLLAELVDGLVHRLYLGVLGLGLLLEVCERGLEFGV
jgi:hypothetical protein